MTDNSNINVTVPVTRRPGLIMPVTLNITTAKVGGLLCSAFEGGSNYWYCITDCTAPANYDAHRAFAFGPIVSHVDYPLNAGGSVTITTLEDDEINGRTSWVLDYEACVRGLNVMAEKYAQHFADMIDDNDDATTGDVFLQCCLFGEVVYG